MKTYGNKYLQQLLRSCPQQYKHTPSPTYGQIVIAKDRMDKAIAEIKRSAK